MFFKLNFNYRESLNKKIKKVKRILVLGIKNPAKSGVGGALF